MRGFWLVAVLLFVIIAWSGSGQQADWVGPVKEVHNWDYKITGFCPREDRCLAGRQRCINSTQFVLDNYCDSGNWTSRTKLMALQLLALGEGSDFSLYCDAYNAVLNQYAYSTSYGTVTTFLRGLCPQPGGGSGACANNICVLKYGNDVAFGLSFNTDISGTKSPLLALNLSSTECDEAKNQDGDYDPCGSDVWYNHDSQSLVYAPGISPLPNPTTDTEDLLMAPYERLKDYVFTYVHDPDVAQYNYTFFEFVPQFKQIYIAQEGNDFAYGFRQANMTLAQIDYAGWYFSNIDLPDDACDRIIKRYDGTANCEEQPEETEFYIAAHKTPPVGKAAKRVSIVDAWREMSKLRVSP